MIKATSLYARQILSLKDAEIVGSVFNILYNKKMTRALYLVVMTTDSEELYCLSPSALDSIDGDALTIASKNNLHSMPIGDKYIDSPLGRKVFSIDGIYMGNVSEIDLLKDFTVVSVKIGDSIFMPYEFKSVSNKLIVLANTSAGAKAMENVTKRYFSSFYSDEDCDELTTNKTPDSISKLDFKELSNEELLATAATIEDSHQDNEKADIENLSITPDIKTQISKNDSKTSSLSPHNKCDSLNDFINLNSIYDKASSDNRPNTTKLNDVFSAFENKKSMDDTVVFANSNVSTKEDTLVSDNLNTIKNKDLDNLKKTDFVADTSLNSVTADKNSNRVLSTTSSDNDSTDYDNGMEDGFTLGGEANVAHIDECVLGQPVYVPDYPYPESAIIASGKEYFPVYSSSKKVNATIIPPYPSKAKSPINQENLENKDDTLSSIDAEEDIKENRIVSLANESNAENETDEIKSMEKIIYNGADHTLVASPSDHTGEIMPRLRIATDCDFLLGRILTRDLISLSGDIIAQRGETITQNVISKSQKSGCLTELAVCAGYNGSKNT